MASPFEMLSEGVYFNPSAEECVRDFLCPWICDSKNRDSCSPSVSGFAVARTAARPTQRHHGRQLEG